MKYVYLFLGIGLLIFLLIPYFQMMVFGKFTFPYYTVLIDNDVRVLIIIINAIMTGTFMTLGIKGFLDNNSIDEGFDL